MVSKKKSAYKINGTSQNLNYRSCSYNLIPAQEKVSLWRRVLFKLLLPCHDPWGEGKHVKESSFSITFALSWPMRLAGCSTPLTSLHHFSIFITFLALFLPSSLLFLHSSLLCLVGSGGSIRKLSAPARLCGRAQLYAFEQLPTRLPPGGLPWCHGWGGP